MLSIEEKMGNNLIVIKKLAISFKDIKNSKSNKTKNKEK
jgi:hypothetical protein